MGEDAESVGIALKMGEIVPEYRRYFALQLCASPLEEICLHRLLSTMTERRVAQVVSQTGCGYNLSDFLKECVFQFWVTPGELLCYIVTRRHACTGHLQGVSQTVVYEDAARKRKHLRLVLQTTERGREDQPVIIAFELRAVIVALWMAVLLPQSLI